MLDSYITAELDLLSGEKSSKIDSPGEEDDDYTFLLSSSLGNSGAGGGGRNKQETLAEF